MKKEGKKSFFIVVGILFLIVSLLHLTRAVLSWQVILGNYEVPILFSYAAFILLIILSILSFKFAKSERR